MSVSTAMLKGALERSTFLLPELPGRIRWLSVPGVEGRISELSHFFANMVGAAAFSEEEAAPGIERVRHIFSSEGKGFTWVVGAITSPSDLGARLLEAGFVKITDMAGMVLTDLRSPISTNPELRIRRASSVDVSAASSVMAAGFRVPEEVIRLLLEARLPGTGHPRSDVYLAFFGQSDTPVGCGTIDYVPDLPIARLGGAVTLQEQRGKGVYTSLVARRVADAAANDIEAVVIQSARESSGPICRKLGFREICDMAMYSWIPHTGVADPSELVNDWTV